MSNVYTWSHLQDCLGTFLRPAYPSTRIRRAARITFQYPPESDQVIMLTCSSEGDNPIHCRKKYISVQIVSSNRFLSDNLSDLSR